MFVRGILAVLLGLTAALSLVASSSASTSSPTAQSGTIGSAKLQGGLQSLTGKIVTGVYLYAGTETVDFFYIEEADRSSGIKVVPDEAVRTGLQLEGGDEVSLSGQVVGGFYEPECYIFASAITVTGIQPVPLPLGMNGLSTAGGAFGLQTALCADALTDPPKMGSGLNAIGMRIRTWGRLAIEEFGGRLYCVDDGSGLRSSRTGPGLSLTYSDYTAVPVWQNGEYITVVGNLGAEVFWMWDAVPVLRLDSTPPDAPLVADDGVNTSSSTQLHAAWIICPDDQSGIERCDYAIGTAPYPEPGWDSIRGWTSPDSPNEASATGLNLIVGATYYFSVRVINGAGLAVVGSSDGITVDPSRERIALISQNSPVPKYEKFEARFSIDPGWTGNPFVDYNPFNPRLTQIGDGSRAWQKKGIYVDAIITRPDGATLRWPCFYDYSRGWKLRYAPDIPGVWSYQIEARFGNETAFSPVGTFICTENTTGKSKRGFLTKDLDWRFFSFSNGEVFYPLGVAVQWDTDIANLGANGGNWVRIFKASYMFEEYAAYPDYVNNFKESKALFWDNYFEKCRDAGVFVIWLCNNWTRWKSSAENPYLVEGVAADLADTFAGAQTREVFKRKLRWMMARWGYSPNLVGFDLINECAYGEGAAAFHEDMAKFVLGVDENVPTEWGVPVLQNDLDRLPHNVSGDMTSSEYRKRDIPWDSGYIGMTHYHDFARIRENGTCLSWTELRWTEGTEDRTGWDVMGSTLTAPWIDAAVWADRMARVNRRSNYQKPLSWTEYGLQFIDSDGGWHDWKDAYYGSTTDPSIIGDLEGRHVKDWYWALQMNAISGVHWDAAWFDTAPTKWWVMKPLSNFLSGIDLRGLTQESYYPVADPLNPTPGILCSNSQVGVFAMRGPNRAYLYVKNLTSTWYYAAGFRDRSVPTPTPQEAAITIRGLAAGSYTVEKWSTTDTNAATQIRSVETRTITPGEDLTFTVTLGDTNDYDWGYKIHQ